MDYDEAAECYTCRNGKQPLDLCAPLKSKTGYVSEKTIYKCEDCNGCTYKSECIKGNNCKTPMEEKDKNASGRKNIFGTKKRRFGTDSFRGRNSFQNKSEYTGRGLFWRLKQDMQFRRYLSKGTSNVLAESTYLPSQET